MKHGKKYTDGAKLIDRSNLYDSKEALDLAVKTATAKFDETVEVHIRLGVAIASPDMMGFVGRLGKVLGPRGLMPSPKAGTVTMDVAKAVQDAKAGKIEYRLDKTNIIHCPIGKASFGADKLLENFNALLDAIIKAKPASSKGQYIKSVAVASTMGPGVKINPNKVGTVSTAE